MNTEPEVRGEEWERLFTEKFEIVEEEFPKSFKKIIEFIKETRAAARIEALTEALTLAESLLHEKDKSLMLDTVNIGIESVIEAIESKITSIREEV